MSNSRPYYTSNRTNGYDESPGSILTALNNNLYFYTMCAVAVLVVLYVIFYVIRQYEYSWAYTPTMNKIASYLPGIKQSQTAPGNT